MKKTEEVHNKTDMPHTRRDEFSDLYIESGGSTDENTEPVAV